MPATTLANDLFRMGEPLLEKGIRTGAVYVGILVLLRLGGKRDLAQLNSFDLVVLLLLSNVVQNAIIGQDNSVAGGLVGAALLVAINGGLVRVLRRNPVGVRLFEGSPTTLATNGEVDHHVLTRLGLHEQDVVNAVRRQGANTLAEVKEAVLMPGGAITVTLQPEAENATKADIARLEAMLGGLTQAQSR